jgi:hypothetical protein
MDLRLSTDPYESFRIFQGRMLEQYLAMSTEFNFVVVDANQLIETQQSMVREIVSRRVDLAQFRRAERPKLTERTKTVAKQTLPAKPLEEAVE